MPTQNQIRASITNQIVQHLSSGKPAPWRKPWMLDRNAGASANVVSKKSYRGINPLLLEIAAMRYGFQSRWWATFNQWKELGGRVQRRPEEIEPGQWGTSIVFWKPIVKQKSDEEEETYCVLRTYTVFNVDQVDGDKLDHLRVGHVDGQLSDQEMDERYDHAQDAIDATGADIRHGGNHAYYHPQSDCIVLPHRHQFSLSEYFETAFHELTHWSEHPFRLNWDRTQPDNTYALGELIAELGGCFLSAEYGLPTAEKLDNHVSYLGTWLESMKEDPKFIFKAAAQANKAADFILSFSRTTVEDRDPVIVV